jgi:hypothetical protein
MGDPDIVVVAIGCSPAGLLFAVAVLDRHDAAARGGNDAIGLLAFHREKIHTPLRTVRAEIVKHLNQRAVDERYPVKAFAPRLGRELLGGGAGKYEACAKQKRIANVHRYSR